MILTYKYRIKDRSARKALRRHARAANYVWNFCVATQRQTQMRWQAHLKIKNCRQDFLHKLSTEIVRDHGLVAVGNVSPSKLAKTRMAKSVIDAGWSMFRGMLRYKCEHARACYLDVDEKFTTVACAECGSLSGPKGQKGLRIRVWECSDCGASHDRDVNAARNILRLALSTQRPVGESRSNVSLTWRPDKCDSRRGNPFQKATPNA